MSQAFTCIGKFGYDTLPITPEKWKQVRNSHLLTSLYEKIRNCSDENEQKTLKKNLYYWTPHCSRFNNNHRSAADAIEVQKRVTLDFDEDKGRSQEICQKALQLKQEQGWGVCLVEESARGGTHVVIEVPENMSAREAAIAFSEALGEQYDPSMLAVEHCLFMSPYTLYIDEELLFRNTYVSAEDAENIWPSAAEKKPDSKAKRQLTKDPNPASPTAFPTHDENGCDLRTLADALVVKHCQNGQYPIEGERHTLLKKVAPQMALKCENNPQWLASVLPSYGLDESEFRSIVQWACNLPQKAYTPRALKEALQRLTSQAGHNMQQPPLPSALPQCMQILLNGTPDKCQPAVAQAVITAMMLYLQPDVLFHCADNMNKIPAGLNIFYAKHGSGKSSVNYPIDAIIAPILKSDMEATLREREWRDQCACISGNKPKPKRPENLVRQLPPPDITSAAFTQWLLDAKGKALYMKMDELDQLLQLTGRTNPKYLGPYIRYAYDAAMWGQARVSSDAVSGTAPLNLKIQASTTPAKALEFFSTMLADGTFDRMTFSTITATGKPTYGDFGIEYERAVHPLIERIRAVEGIVNCPEALEWSERMEQEHEALADEMDCKAYKDLLPRAIQNAFFRAVMVYLMEDSQWTPEIEQFATWSLENDLWCKWQLFGQKLIETQEYEDAIMRTAPRMRSRTLDTLPPTFTKEDLIQVYLLQGKSEATADCMLRQWKSRKIIRYDEQTQMYCKMA